MALTTQQPTDVTETEATLIADYDYSEGPDVDYIKFYWSRLTESSGGSTTIVETFEGDQLSTPDHDSTFMYDISDLDLEGHYRYEAYAYDENGNYLSSYDGGLVWFTTEGNGPEMSTVSANPGDTSVILTGEILDLGDLSSVDGDFFYREGDSGDWEEFIGSEYTSPTTYSEEIFGLSDNTYYEYIAVGWFSGHRAYGSIKSFTTEEEAAWNYPMKYWNGSSWVEADREKVMAYSGSYQNPSVIKAYINGSWQEL